MTTAQAIFSLVIVAIIIAKEMALNEYAEAWTKDPEDKNLRGLSRWCAAILVLASAITAGVIGGLAIVGMISLITNLM